jgi:hypothetical protein
MKRLQPLDIVRTSFGTLCVVNEVSSNGSVSLVLPLGSSQKYAWYDPEEVVFVSSVKDVCAQVPALPQEKPKREKIKYPAVFLEMAESLNDMYSNKFGTPTGRDHDGMN